MSYDNKWKGKGSGGGKKEFTADPLKQFLITRAVSLGQAVQLCIADKIELKDIQNTTDKFTLVQYGMIELTPKVEKEVIRIASKVQERAKDKTPDDTPPSADRQADEEAYAADQRTQEAEERQHAEDDYDEAMDRDEKHDLPPLPNQGVIWECPSCDRKYKSAQGLEKHVKTVHNKK